MGFLVEENDWKTARVSYRGGNLGFLGLSASLLISDPQLCGPGYDADFRTWTYYVTNLQLEVMMACVFKFKLQASGHARY
jgi:hypothetical protein